MVIEDSTLVSLYGKDFADKEKSSEDCQKSASKKSPRVNVPDGAEIVFPDTIRIFTETSNNAATKKVFSFETFPCKMNGIDFKFPVGWLEKTGYSIVAFGATAKECEEDFKENTDLEPIEGQTSACQGNIVDMWQNAANQDEAKSAIAGKTCIAHIVGWIMTKWDEYPKPLLEFTEKVTTPARGRRASKQSRFTFQRCVLETTRETTAVTH